MRERNGGAAAGYAALLALALLWGWTWVVVKVATASTTPFALNAIRTVLSTAALFALLALGRRSLRPPPLAATAFIGVTATTGFMMTQTLAVALGGAGKAAILYYVFPFVVALLSRSLLGERIARRTWIGLCFAVAGIVLIAAPAMGGRTTVATVVFPLLGALSWSIGAIATKRLQGGHAVDALTLGAWQSLFGTIPLVVIAVAVPGERIGWTPGFALAIAYIAFCGTALAIVLWLFALRRLSATATSVTTLLTPLVAIATSWLALGEVPSGTELGGIASIVLALVLHAWPAGRIR